MADIVMTAPAVKLSATTRYALKELKLERSGTTPAGRVMYCQGRKVLAFGDVEELHRARFIAPRADTLCVAAADYDDVKAWIG
jgi:hypothetical protein